MGLILLGPCVPIKPKRGAQIIAIDGGLDHAKRFKLKPALAVGDWDSLKKKALLKKIPNLTLRPDKDQSDLACALALARGFKPARITALGVTGGRPDHHLASLFELSQAALDPAFRSTEIRAEDRDAEYFFIAGPSKHSFKIARGRVFSVFSCDGSARGVKISGAHFATSLSNLKPSSLGLSNRSAGRVEVRIRRGVLVLVVPKPLI